MLTTLNIKLSLACYLFIPINSGLRSAEHNRRVGGWSNSKHLTGQAFDLGTHLMTDDEWFCVTETAYRLFRKVVVYPNHIHVE